MVDSKILKTIKDLMYRIKVSDPSDPELGNAQRLLTRLCEKYNVSPDDLRGAEVETRSFPCATREELQLVAQYLYVKAHYALNDLATYTIKSTRYGKKSFRVEVKMTQDDYSAHARIITELLLMFRRRRAEYEKQLEKEMALKLKAWDYEFEKAGGMLAQAEPGSKCSTPSWGLHEAMQAAKDLEGAVFPESYLANQQKILASAV